MEHKAPGRKVIEVLSDAIRVARARRRISQATFAHRVGISGHYLGTIERMEANPQITTVERIFDELGMTVTISGDAA